ncbi:hypothetical protein NOVO_04680 [Rickettsiales bacterium Ac37b]|nr:hypothetical protein NOVO_04680 [Rickettsiales bacterium Ac37b]
MLQDLITFPNHCTKYKSLHGTASSMRTELDIEDALPFIEKIIDQNLIYVFSALKGQSATDMYIGTALQCKDIVKNFIATHVEENFDGVLVVGNESSVIYECA